MAVKISKTIDKNVGKYSRKVAGSVGEEQPSKNNSSWYVTSGYAAARLRRAQPKRKQKNIGKWTYSCDVSVVVVVVVLPFFNGKNNQKC